MRSISQKISRKIREFCPEITCLSLYATKTFKTNYANNSNSRNIIGRNLSMVIPLLANQDLRPMLIESGKTG